MFTNHDPGRGRTLYRRGRHCRRDWQDGVGTRLTRPGAIS